MKMLWKILLAAALWVAGPAPASAAWLRAESDNFVVIADTSEARLRAQVAMLEDYAQLLRTLMHTEAPPSPSKLRIYLVHGPRELNVVRDLPPAARGVYITGVDGVAAVADVTANPDNPIAVLFHEYAHHFMMQYHGRVYPPWYIEGFAEYLMTARFADRVIEFGRPDPGRARLLADSARWLPLERVLSGRTEDLSDEDKARYYAQSWLLTHYLLNDSERLGRFRNYLTALGTGQDPRAALQASFGMTPAQLQRQLVAYATGGLTVRRLDRATAAQPPRITVTPLPPSADDLLLLQGALHVGLRDDGDRLARIRQLAAGRSDAFARRVLAQAEATYGDAAAADRLLDALISESPGDAELLYFRGMRYLTGAEHSDGAARTEAMRQARLWFGRAFRIDRNHFQTVYRYVQSVSEQPNFVSEANLEVLLMAQSLAPQVAGIRVNAARMLMLLDHYDLAEGLLIPLAESAHRDALTEIAQDLLAKARARSREGVALSF